MTDTNNTDVAALLPVTANESLRGRILDIIRDTLEIDGNRDVGTYIAGMDDAAGKIAGLLSEIQSHSLPGDVGDEEQPGDYLRDDLLNIAAICEAKALHVEAASLRSTARIVSEQLRKAQQSPEMTRGSVGHVKVLCGLLQEFVEAMERYQMDVDDDAPPRHRDMMERAYAALTPSPCPATQEDAERSSSTASSVGADVDALAAILAPFAFKSWQGMVDHCLNSGDDQQTAEFYATETYGGQMEQARVDAKKAIDYFATLSTPAMSDRQEYDGEAVREALNVGERFLNACNSAWAAGEPSHRVETMLDLADEFRDALAALAHPAQARDEMPAQTVEETGGLVEALGKAIVFSAYRASDPLAIRFEFANDDDRVAAADAVDEAFLLGVHGIRAALSSDKGEDQ